MTVFEQSHTWDELIRHFEDSYVMETDKEAVSAFYDRDYIAERLKRLDTEVSLKCRITLNGEERWVRNVIIRGELDVYKRQRESWVSRFCISRIISAIKVCCSSICPIMDSIKGCLLYTSKTS